MVPEGAASPNFHWPKDRMHSAKGPSMRILVVEDDYISRRLLCRYLEPFGTCEEAVNGYEAIDAIRRSLAADQYYDLICLDIMMPGMDGQQVLVLLRQMELDNDRPLGKGAKVIMTSAMEENQYILQALNASADGYVVKPIQKQSFIETLKEAGLLMDPTPRPVEV
jgi:two-component system chemotaxis response regulator CheY